MNAKEKATESVVKALQELLEWGRWNTSPVLDPRSPHEQLKAANSALEAYQAAQKPLQSDALTAAQLMSELYEGEGVGGKTLYAEIYEIPAMNREGFAGVNRLVASAAAIFGEEVEAANAGPGEGVSDYQAALERFAKGLPKAQGGVGMFTVDAIRDLARKCCAEGHNRDLAQGLDAVEGIASAFATIEKKKEVAANGLAAAIESGDVAVLEDFLRKTEKLLPGLLQHHGIKQAARSAYFAGRGDVCERLVGAGMTAGQMGSLHLAKGFPWRKPEDFWGLGVNDVCGPAFRCTPDVAERIISEGVIEADDLDAFVQDKLDGGFTLKEIARGVYAAGCTEIDEMLSALNRAAHTTALPVSEEHWGTLIGEATSICSDYPPQEVVGALLESGLSPDLLHAAGVMRETGKYDPDEIVAGVLLDSRPDAVHLDELANVIKADGKNRDFDIHAEVRIVFQDDVKCLKDPEAIFLRGGAQRGYLPLGTRLPEGLLHLDMEGGPFPAGTALPDSLEELVLGRPGMFCSDGGLPPGTRLPRGLKKLDLGGQTLPEDIREPLGCKVVGVGPKGIYGAGEAPTQNFLAGAPDESESEGVRA